jgi:hypothetical protein
MNPPKVNEYDYIQYLSVSLLEPQFGIGGIAETLELL